MMNKTLFLFTWLLVMPVIIFATSRYNVIPYPNQIKEKAGDFQFKAGLTVKCDPMFGAELAAMRIHWKNDFFTELKHSGQPAVVIEQNKKLPQDGYRLVVSPTRITIQASHSQGCAYAITTLRQLTRLDTVGFYSIPACEISDKPSYVWRAFMLDEARHFKGKDVVKTMLDQMAYLKMNVFHWHLVDAQGWRIEIKKYPELTNVGAWRKRTQIRRVPKGDPIPYNDITHGGFYTQDDIKEIIEYAAKLHITIVPEIEMPGHASAAIAAYPWLSSSDEKIDVPCRFSINYQTYNVANPKVYTFLTDVIREVVDLFPSKIIHIGGDEVKYDHWNKNPEIQALMQKNGLVNGFDVQIHFVNRISKFVESCGARMMGWNEIMGKNVHEWSEDKSGSKQELSKDAIVHFWKGEPDLLKDAIGKGYKVVNSNHWDTYLDYTYQRIPLAKSYAFSPIPDGTLTEDKKNILGLGCQMWSEYIPKVSDMYYQVFPRIAAYAEVGWTEKENKDFDRFSSNLVSLKRYWDGIGIIYYEE